MLQRAQRGLRRGRVRADARFGAVCTTYGVGELAAISAIAGSYAEHLVVFHVVGTPNRASQETLAFVHHTLGDGRFDVFSGMAQAVVCASTVLTPQNAAAETERLIAEALYHRRPVYMAIPSDVANMPVLAAAPTFSSPTRACLTNVLGVVAEA
jgi:indolepyruvate decarboxylase